MDGLTNIEEMFLIVIWRLKNEAYGYRIRGFISEQLGRDVSYGNLYSVLGQLVKKGYVTKQEERGASQGPGKKRIFYSVSREGLRALRDTKEVRETLWKGVSGLATEEN
ncbi:MAG TPA: PadR family transcriptional regulator [Candidatus Krumholzibacterium sp.]|nr:PadR family transcriptional regulator [Candidatus Krumholzibacterium sp.]